MTIKIAHLYPNELNLYGENGNIKALTYALKEQDIAYIITNIDFTDPINFNDYDFIYIGSGRKIFLDKARQALEPYKENILNYLKQDKVFLITGNAVSIFEFLNFYEVTSLDNFVVGNVCGTTSLCKGQIKAFQNTEYLIKSTDNLIFSLDTGYGNNNTMLEGYQKNNFYATTLIGPLLARNPNLTKYFIDILKENQK